jgi:queuosine precursor transporter
MSLFTEKPAAVQARDLRTYRHFDLLLAIFIVVLLISNLVGQKLCAIGPFVLSGAQLLFPITYIFGDVFTEVYGYAASRRAIWLGFLANGLLAVMGLITVWLPPAPGWPNQEAFATVFYTIPRLIVASLVAYWCGEFANSYTLAKMKLWTGGRMLWTRTVGSTVAGQAVDTVLLYIIGFGGTAPVSTLARGAASAYFFKVVYEVVATPGTYAIVGFLKRSEGLDAFDFKSDFNPFHVGTHS